MEKKNTKKTSIASGSNMYNKSNYLIGAKFKSSLLENKVMALSLANADCFDIDEKTGSIYSRMRVSELRDAMGYKGGSFYGLLNDVAKTMTGKSIGVSSADNKTFRYVAIVISATCKDGIFTIEYNHSVRSMLSNLKANYARLNLATMLSFTSTYSFRLYELLKSKCYRAKDDPDTSNDYHIKFLLSELKLELGVVNADARSVKKILNNSTNPDYDEAVASVNEDSYDHMFATYSEFRRQVLDRGVKEINEKSDLYVEYKAIRHGVGGKVEAIVFDVSVNAAKAVSSPETLNKISKPKNTKSLMTKCILTAHSLMGDEYSSDDILAICEAAEYDEDKIIAAKKAMDESGSSINNTVGWMIAAIKGGYSENVKPASKTSKKAASGRTSSKTADSNSEGKTKKSTARKPKNAFNNFEQNDYDFDELELLLNSI